MATSRTARLQVRGNLFDVVSAATVVLDRRGTLICEVSDGGHTSPHLRHAGMEDEGGRGLYLVAQFTDRWGTRYTHEGKTIWTELPLGVSAAEQEIPLLS